MAPIEQVRKLLQTLSNPNNFMSRASHDNVMNFSFYLQVDNSTKNHFKNF